LRDSSTQQQSYAAYREAVPTNLLAAFSAITAHPRVRAEDGATNTYHYETPGSAGSSLVITGASELHRAK
jgi:hypothetical protein